MKAFGVIVLSFEEVAGLGDLLPWKSVPSAELYRKDGRLGGVPWEGFVVLSTCNRVEFIYTLGGEAPEGERAKHAAVYRELVERMPALPAGVLPRAQTGRRAMEHLIRLASGLESLVLGESEIKAQLIAAKHEARAAGGLHSSLHTLLQQVFRESREIRNAVPMHHLPLSLPALAARRLRADAPVMAILPKAAHSGTTESFDEHNRADRQRTAADRTAPALVIVGSGPMSKQVAEYLVKWSARLVWVNRTRERVLGAAERIGAEVVAFEQFQSDPTCVGPVAGIVTATSRPDPFVTPEFISRMLPGENGITIVDLALPMDTDPLVGELPGVRLVTMDSMRAELETNRARRKEAADAAEEFVVDALVRIEARLISTHSGRILRKVQRQIRDRSRRSLEDLLGNRLAHLSARDRRALYDWAIRSNRELNRIHREGVENVLHEYYGGVAQTG